MRGLGLHLRTGLTLYVRNRMALVYGYLFPTVFLLAFWVLYRYERVPLVREGGARAGQIEPLIVELAARGLLGVGPIVLVVRARAGDDHLARDDRRHRDRDQRGEREREREPAAQLHFFDLTGSPYRYTSA